MASCDWEKCKSEQVKHIIRHCSKDKRKEDNHANKNINSKLTDKNISFSGAATYDELCSRYDDRIKELDSTTNKNKRKDRVTTICFELPVPESMIDKQGNVDPRAADWLRRADEVLGDFLKSKGVSPKSHIYSEAHFDEVHKYFDPEQKRWRYSLPHLHRMDVAEIGGSLNAKALETKSNLTEINAAIEQMSQDEFGLQWQTGTKRKSRDAVETMKHKTAKEETRVYAAAVKKLQEQQNDLTNNIALIQQRERAVEEREKQAEEYISSEVERRLYAFSEALQDDVVTALQQLPKTPYTQKIEQFATKEPQATEQAIRSSARYQSAMSDMQQREYWEQLRKQGDNKNPNFPR